MTCLVRNLVLSLALATLTAGCGASSSEVKVEGTVTFMQTPVESGEIVFMPEDPNSPNVAGKIEQGKYSCMVKPGPAKVSITAYREVPGQVDTSNPGQTAPVMEMYIPPQFNSNSTLSVLIDAAKNPVDFPLGSS